MPRYLDFLQNQPPRRRRVSVSLSQIHNSGFLDIRNPEDKTLIQVIYTGTIISQISGGQPREWNHTVVTATINTGNGRKWTEDPNRVSGWTFLDSGVALVVPASFSNMRSSACGWAVDESIVAIQPGSEGSDDSLVLLAIVAVFDTSTKIDRLSYQVTVVGREV